MFYSVCCISKVFINHLKIKVKIKWKYILSILWCELFCGRMQKSDGGENMFLPSFMRQQSRVSCFYYWEYNIVWNTCFQSPSEISLLTLASFYNARDGSKRSQSQIQMANYLKHTLLCTVRSISVSALLLNVKHVFWKKFSVPATLFSSVQVELVSIYKSTLLSEPVNEDFCLFWKSILSYFSAPIEAEQANHLPKSLCIIVHP